MYQVYYVNKDFCNGSDNPAVFNNQNYHLRYTDIDYYDLGALERNLKFRSPEELAFIVEISDEAPARFVALLERTINLHEYEGEFDTDLALFILEMMVQGCSFQGILDAWKIVDSSEIEGAKVLRSKFQGDKYDANMDVQAAKLVERNGDCIFIHDMPQLNNTKTPNCYIDTEENREIIKGFLKELSVF